MSDWIVEGRVSVLSHEAAAAGKFKLMRLIINLQSARYVNILLTKLMIFLQRPQS